MAHIPVHDHCFGGVVHLSAELLHISGSLVIQDGTVLVVSVLHIIAVMPPHSGWHLTSGTGW